MYIKLYKYKNRLMLPFTSSDNFSFKSMKNRVQINNAFNNRLGNSSQLNTTEYQMNNSKFLDENKYGILISRKPNYWKINKHTKQSTRKITRPIPT